MERTWNRCLAAGTVALAVGIAGSLATVEAPAWPPAPAPLVSYFSRSPRAPGAVASRLTRTLLCAFFC